MKLLSYKNDDVGWGIVITDRGDRTEYVLNPRRAQQFLNHYCGDRTVGYFLNRPCFFSDGVPHDMIGFLNRGKRRPPRSEIEFAKPCCPRSVSP